MLTALTACGAKYEAADADDLSALATKVAVLEQKQKDMEEKMALSERIAVLEEQVKELFINDGTDHHGIGVKNVNDRIKIYFGEKYGITVRSELDEGTCVVIRIPKVTEERKYEK